MEAQSSQGTEVEYQGITAEEPEKDAVASERVTQLIGAQEVQIESVGETESEEDLEQVFDVESGKTIDQEGSEIEVVFRYSKKVKKELLQRCLILRRKLGCMFICW